MNRKLWICVQQNEVSSPYQIALMDSGMSVYNFHFYWSEPFKILISGLQKILREVYYLLIYSRENLRKYLCIRKTNSM